MGPLRVEYRGGAECGELYFSTTGRESLVKEAKCLASLRALAQGEFQCGAEREVDGQQRLHSERLGRAFCAALAAAM